MGGGDAAKLGTAAHFLLEKSLSERIPPIEFLGRFIVLLGDEEDGSMLKAGAKQPTKGTWFEVDEDMAENVGIAYDYVERRLQELDVPRGDLKLESKTNPCPDREDTWGTADVSLDAWPILLEVVDYKNGFGLVDHEDNPQLLSYLAGRAHDTGWSHDHYRITVIQPNATFDDGKKIRSFDISKADLQAFVVKHRNAAIQSDEAADDLATLGNDPKAQLGILGDAGEFADATWADAWLKAGQHCDDTYCEGRLICPAYRMWKQKKAGAEFGDEPPPDPVDPKTFDLQAEMAVDILAWEPHWTSLVKLARAYEAKLRKEGKTLPGRKLVRGKPRGRVWKDGLGVPEAIAKAMVKAGYISDNERARLFTLPVLLTGPAAEKLVPSKLRKAFSADFLIMPKGPITSVSVDDPREAVVVNAADDFPDEEGDE